MLFSKVRFGFQYGKPKLTYGKQHGAVNAGVEDQDIRGWIFYCESVPFSLGMDAMRSLPPVERSLDPDCRHVHRFDYPYAPRNPIRGTGGTAAVCPRADCTAGFRAGLRAAFRGSVGAPGYASERHVRCDWNGRGRRRVHVAVDGGGVDAV